MNTHNVMIMPDEFAELVRGKIVERQMPNGDIVNVALSNIGFCRMSQMVDEAAIDFSANDHTIEP
jgi:hypothetical protein